MAQTSQQEEQFPELFNDGRMRVFKNPSNEIFVENVATGAQMRISSNVRGLGFTTFGGSRVQPTVVAGSVGWEVVK